MKLRTNLPASVMYSNYLRFSLLALMVMMAAACNDDPAIPEEEIVDTREQIDAKAGVLIKEFLVKARADSGRISDSVYLYQPQLADYIYDYRSYTTLWSDRDSLFPAADTLIGFINEARTAGLYPQNYHAAEIMKIRNAIMGDTAGTGPSRDALLWAKTDLYLTDAFVQLLKDIKFGRIPADSITLRKDTLFQPDLVSDQMMFLIKGKSLARIISQFEPHHQGYKQLKAAIGDFLAAADFDKQVTKIEFPVTDSFAYKSALTIRLKEEGLLPDSVFSVDNSALKAAVKAFQKKNDLEADGKAGQQTIRELNTSDNDRFLQLAITLDRYKQLPDTMPDKYIWVNIPAFKMYLSIDDSVFLESRVVVGKPETRTPVLTSAISEMITYPQWTIPTSIIVKEILPGLKKSTDYLEKKGYSLVARNGDEVNPDSVNWFKYTKGIPYKVVQGSGDANALGIMKFNFGNKYAVYLHDTNQRYYFSKDDRALSHGCVRVQQWKQLSDFILSNDSIQAGLSRYGRFTPSDSVNKWLAVKEKHSIPVRNRIPLFIRYYTCEAINGHIHFYEDIYGEDASLRKYYLSSN